MRGRNLVGNRDRSGGKRKRHRQKEERVRTEKTTQMGQARHGRTIGSNRGNPGRFRYETRMSGPKIPLQGEKHGYLEGSR